MRQQCAVHALATQAVETQSRRGEAIDEIELEGASVTLSGPLLPLGNRASGRSLSAPQTMPHGCRHVG